MNDDVKTLSAGGVPPKTRIGSAPEASRLVQQLIKDDLQRAAKRATVQGQLDGNPPYNPAELKRLGQSHRTNLNTREAKGNHNTRRSTYYDLMMEVPCLLDISVREDNPSMTDWGMVIAEEASRVIKEWPEFLYNIMLHEDQMILFGIGPIMFPDKIDWRFKAFEMGAVMVPNDSKACTGSLKACVFTHEYDVTELFEHVTDDRTAEHAKESGWNPAAIKAAIIGSAIQGSQKTLSTWEDVQKCIKNSDLSSGYVDFHTVYAAHLLYREFDGTISHAIMLDTGDESRNKEFLYHGIGNYGSWDEVVHMFFAEIGTNGKYHSVRGLDQETYSHCALNDRLTSQVIDAGITSGTILVQPTAGEGGDPSKMRVMRVGPFTRLPAGLSVVKSDFNPQMQGLLGVINFVRANLAGFAGMNDAMPEDMQSKGSPSLGIEKLRLSKEGKLERGLVMFYYQQLDSLWREVVRRLLNSNYTKHDPGYDGQQNFIQACIGRGVPLEFLDPARLSVSAMRAIGYGSPAMRRIDTQEILSVSPHMDEVGRNNALRDWTAARCGYRQVDRYFPAINRNQIPTSEHSMANLENNDFREGQSVVVGVDQPHIIHLIVHMPPLSQMAEAFTRGQMAMPIEEMYTYFETALQHVALHIDYLRGDKSREIDYRQFLDAFQDIARVFNQMKGEVQRLSQQRQAQAQAQQEAVQKALSQTEDMKLMVQLRELEGDLQLKAEKEANMNAIRQQKADNTIAISRRMADLREETMRRKMNTETGSTT